MGDEILNPDNNSDLILDDGSSVSLDVFQAVHKEIVGKSEKLSKLLKDHHVIELADVEQLLMKLTQAASQYKVISANSSATVFHCDDNRAVFSSFEQLRRYDTSITSPVKSIEIEYNFIISNHTDSRPNSYKISVSLSSRAALRQTAAEAHGVEAMILHLGTRVSGQIDVEYHEYLVGRFIMSTIEEWYKGVKKETDSWLVRAINKHENWLPVFFRTVSILIMAAIVQGFATEYFLSDAPVGRMLLILSLFFIAVYIVDKFSFRLAHVFTNAIERLYPVSALKFNKGDDLVIEEYSKVNSKIIFRSMISAALNLLVSVAGGLLVLQIVA